MNTTTRATTDTDRAVVCTLHQTAVGSEAEANLVEALHESGDVRLALVA